MKTNLVQGEESIMRANITEFKKESVFQQIFNK